MLNGAGKRTAMATQLVGVKNKKIGVMKKTYKFLAALCGVAVLMAACTKDETLQPQYTPAAVGDEVLFGVRAGFENSDESRTEYSGETYTVGNTTFERIDWVDKDGINELYDQIEILSPEASNGPSAHYDVYHSQVAGDQKDYAYLGKQDDSALQWKNDEEHTFYAMYPSSRMFPTQTAEGEDITVDQGIRLEEKTDGTVVMHGEIPLNQPGEALSPNNDGNYVVKPDMRYAYMAAKTVATRLSQTEDETSGTQQGIKLTFVPVVTAVNVEFTLASTTANNQEATAIEITDLQVEGEGIVGKFTADLSTWAGADPTTATTFSYPDCDVEGTTTNQITIPLKEAITLQPGKKIEFTVFMMPTADLSSLKVKFTSTGVFQTRTLVKKSSTQTSFIKPFCKNKFAGVDLPATGVEYDLSNWMENLSNDFTMKRLSLPGTGGSFSYNYSGSNAQYYAEQHTGSTTAADGTTPAQMDFNAQWEAGIRAFEIVSDRATSELGDWGDIAKLGNITCNKESVNITVTTAMNNLIELVQNSDECAVVVFTYQPDGGILERWGEKYIQSLALWFDDLTDDQKKVFKKYTPDLKLGKKGSELASGETTTANGDGARGHIMVLVRPNQRHEKDSGADMETMKQTLKDYECPFVIIDGCGTAKDRWGARGYKIKVGDVEYPMLDQSNSYSSYKYDGTNAYTNNMIIETYMTSDVLGFDTYDTEKESDGYVTYDSYTPSESNYTVLRPMGGSYASLNFEFETDVTGVSVWYQEWQRVSEKKQSFKVDAFFSSWGPHYWFESYNEKLDNAKQTFTKAINDTDGNTIYINSLCGFFAASTPSDSGRLSTGSAYGGSGGDIAGLANAINPAFSQIVNESGFEQTTGPTGIIFMDRVTSGMEVIGKIISNNYKFSLAE